MAFVEDRQLLELSLSPKRALFPVLSRAEALSPLIVILALVPPLYVLVNRTLTPLDALWGMKAVMIASSDGAGAWVDPAQISASGREIPLKWQPPLSSWLIAGVMSLTSTDRPLALVMVSFLSTCGLIFGVFGLADRLRGPQFAWWSTCLVALSGPILLGAQTPAPMSLTLALSLATFWGFVAHVQDAKRLLSLSLVLSGFCWGFCLLAGGPVALVVLAVLLLTVLSLSQEVKKIKKSKATKARGIWKTRPALQSLGLVLAIGFAVGGWWGVWMLAHHGGEFLVGWLTGAGTLPEVGFPDYGYFEQILVDSAQQGGALAGLGLLGLISALFRLKQTDSAERNFLSFLFAWAGCAGILWLCLRASPQRHDAFSIVWRGFALIPMTLLAAFAIERIAERKIGNDRVLLTLVLTGGLLLLIPVEVGFGQSVPREPLWSSWLPAIREFFTAESPDFLPLLWGLLSGFAIGGGVCWWTWRKFCGNDVAHRIFLSSSLALLIVVHGVIGYLGVRQTTMEDQALANIRKNLHQQFLDKPAPVPPEQAESLEPRDSAKPDKEQVTRWTIISPHRSPMVLRFVLTSIWPKIDLVETNSWYSELTRELKTGDKLEGVHLVLEWNDRDTRILPLRVTDHAGQSHIVDFMPVGTPQILWDHRLRIYRLTDRLIRRSPDS